MILRFATDAMATRFELVLEGEAQTRLRALAEEAFEEVRECEALWSVFRAGSLVSKVNREAGGRPVVVDRLTFELLEEGLEVWGASRGFFDPALGRAMERWGFREGADADVSVSSSANGNERGQPPYRLDPAAGTIHSLRPDSLLDLGAIAKGRALDLAADHLRDQGVTRALLHGGTSSVVAIGAPEGSEGWLIALDDSPDAPRACLRDSALAVSSNSGRRNSHGGHVLDPHAQEPTGDLSMVAVVAPRASTADAWATALCAARGRALELPVELSALRREEPTSAADSGPWRTSSRLADPFHFSAAQPA